MIKGYAEQRKQRIAQVAKRISDGLNENGKVNFDELVTRTMFETGVTDKKAREYLSLVIRLYHLNTEVEKTKTGRIYWIKPST